MCIHLSQVLLFYSMLPHPVVFSAFRLLLDIKMSTITDTERPIATNPAGINNGLKESALNLPIG